MALIVVAVALSLIVWPRLPEIVPIHWNASGQIDGYAPRLEGVAVVPMAMLVVLGVFALLSLIPRKSRAHDFILVSILVFLLAVHVLVLLAAIAKGSSS